MAEIRCPMCGKPNPSERDTCLYCQARLKSLTGSSFMSSDSSSSSIGIPSQPDTGDSSLPDWLKAIRNSDQTSEESESEPLPAWITGEGGEGFDEPDDTEKIEVPDWLANLRQEGEKVHTSALSEDKLNKLPIDDEPEWLKKIRTGQHEEPSPDFKQVLPPEKPFPAVSERPIVFQAKEEIPSSEVPDWVAELSGKSAVSSELLPDEQEKDIPMEEVHFEPKEEEGSLLAWLSTLEQEKTAQAAPTQSEKPITVDRGKEEVSFSSEVSGLFSDLEGIDFGIDTKESFEIAKDEKRTTEIPQPLTSPFTSVEGLDEFAELPEWLGGISSEETIAHEKDISSIADQDLAPATLPNWLEAFIPAEAIEKPSTKIPLTEAPRKAEGAGPLAGLFSVLPAEPEIAKSRKPSEKPDVLEVSEKHRQQTSVFEALLSSEGLPGVTAERQIVAPQNVFRILVFLLLCAGVLGVIIAGYQFAVIPTPPVETLDAINILNSLPAGAPVLIAVDYQPGYSGEMEAAASIILDHLMVNGVNLAFVSTNPTGPAQIERLISRVNQERGHQYKALEQYVIMGYIPGGTTGLSGFGTQPRRIITQSADGKPIWRTPWLSNINNISDFSSVIIATDDPDNARAWVEQVQPLLQNKPLLMAISAQAEPMVRPYYETNPRQVSGLVVGLMGSAAYEQIINRPGAAIKYWSPFNAAIMIAMLMIVLGSCYMMVMMLRTQRKENRREG